MQNKNRKIIFRLAMLFIIILGFSLSRTVSAQDEDGGTGNSIAVTTVAEPNNLIEGKISAYKAVACSADIINKNISRFQGSIGTLLVYDAEFADTLSEYSILMSRFKLLERKYKETFAIIKQQNLKKSSETGVRGITDFIDPFQKIRDITIDTLSLFKTNTSVQGLDVRIRKEAFIAKTVNNLNIDLYYPNKAVPIVFDDSDLLTIMSDLSISRLRAEDALKYIDPDEEVHFQLRVFNLQFDRMLTQFSEPVIIEADADLAKQENNADKNANDESLRRNLYKTITDFLRAEVAYKKLRAANNNDTYWLDVEIAAAGSNLQNKNNLIFDIFTGGNRLAFSAGAVVSYRIFDFNGKVLIADTVMTYMPYKKPGKITEFVCRPTKTNVIP